MPVDGTFGRLRAHKERMNMLYSKKKNKQKRNKYVGAHKSDNKILSIESNPEVITNIRSKLKARRIKETKIQLLLLIITIVITSLIAGYLYVLIT